MSVKGEDEICECEGERMRSMSVRIMKCGYLGRVEEFYMYLTCLHGCPYIVDMFFIYAIHCTYPMVFGCLLGNHAYSPYPQS